MPVFEKGLQVSDDDFVPGNHHAPLLPSNLRHRERLAAQIKFFKSRDGLKYQHVLDQIRNYCEEFDEVSFPSRDLSLSRLQDFSSRPANVNLSGETLNVVYRFLNHKNCWDEHSSSRNRINTIDGGLFLSLAELFATPEEECRIKGKQLQGTYRIYRPILTHPGMYVIGVLELSFDKKTLSVQYQEWNAIPAYGGREAKSQKIIGTAVAKENFIIMIGRENVTSKPHYTIFNNCEHQGGSFNVMRGFFLDSHAAQLYAGGVIVERIPDDELARCVDIEKTFDEKFSCVSCCASEEKIPPSALAYFRSINNDGNLIIA